MESQEGGSAGVLPQGGRAGYPVTGRGKKLAALCPSQHAMTRYKIGRQCFMRKRELKCCK